MSGSQGVTISAQSVQQIIALLQGSLQQAGNGQNQQMPGMGQNQLNTQSFFGDLGNIISSVGSSLIGNQQVQQAAGGLINEVLGWLSNNPASRQQTQQLLQRYGQQAGLQTQDIWSTLGGIVSSVAPTVIQYLPDILSFLSNQPRVGGLQTQGVQPGINYRGYTGGNYTQTGQQQGWN